MKHKQAKKMRQHCTNNATYDNENEQNDNEGVKEEREKEHKNIPTDRLLKIRQNITVVTTTNKTVSESTLEYSLKWQLCAMCIDRH